MKFLSAGAQELAPDFLLKPYLYAGGGKEFFVIPIPAEAERCQVQLKLSKTGKEVEFKSFRAVVERQSSDVGK